MSSLANGGEHDKRVGIIGIPFSKGQPKNGADLGPSAIRAQKLVRTITNLGWTVDDRGDIDFSSLPAQETERVGKLKNTRTVGAGNKLIHDAVLKMAMENDFALMLGGDHSVAIGYVSISFTTTFTVL
jgi:arginase